MRTTIRARCSAQHRKSLVIVSALGGGQAIDNVGTSTADPGLSGNLPASLFASAACPLPSLSSGSAARGSIPNPAILGPFLRHAGTCGRGTLNLLRRLWAAGSPSFSRVRRQDLPKSFGVAGILLTPFHHSVAGPFSGLVALSDGHRDSERKQGNVRFSSGEIQNV